MSWGREFQKRYRIKCHRINKLTESKILEGEEVQFNNSYNEIDQLQKKHDHFNLHMVTI